MFGTSTSIKHGLCDNKGNNKITELRTIFLSMCWRKNIFDIYVTEYGTALTTFLPILFLYLNTVTVTAEPLNRNESERFGALDVNVKNIFTSTHWQKNSWHFWLLYLYTFTLYENASLIIFSAETEYISTRYWYRL
jgi:hypothetical protein